MQQLHAFYREKNLIFPARDKETLPRPAAARACSCLIFFFFVILADIFITAMMLPNFNQLNNFVAMTLRVSMVVPFWWIFKVKTCLWYCFWFNFQISFGEMTGRRDSRLSVGNLSRVSYEATFETANQLPRDLLSSLTIVAKYYHNGLCNETPKAFSHWTLFFLLLFAYLTHDSTFRGMYVWYISIHGWVFIHLSVDDCIVDFESYRVWYAE